MYGKLTVLAQAVLSILEPLYLFRNCLHTVKNLICLLVRQAFSSFGLKPYSSLFVRYLKLYVNEQIVNNDVSEDSPIGKN